MATDLLEPVLQLIDQYGVIAVFVFLALDAAMLMPLVPGEFIIILAATRFSSNYTELAFMVVVASVAATLGALFVYGVARGLGATFFDKHPKLLFMSPKTKAKMERLFQRPSGQSLILILRVVPIVRLLVSLPAGLAKVPVFRYTVLTFLGSLIFHAGFMYLAFESQRADSRVFAQTESLKAGYANPAWDYVQTNWTLVALIALGLGILLSIKASVKMHRNPHESDGSLLGTAANATLFWGGAGILAGLWIDPNFLYDTIAVTGVDVRTVKFTVPYAPASVVAAVGGGALFLSYLISKIRRSAKRKAKRAQKHARLVKQLDAQPKAIHEQRFR